MIKQVINVIGMISPARLFDLPCTLFEWQTSEQPFETEREYTRAVLVWIQLQVSFAKQVHATTFFITNFYDQSQGQ